MGWDWSQRRASRSCLFPLKHLGARYAAEPDRAEEDGRQVCGVWDTNMEGMCPLHAGLPHTFMTPEAWAKVAEAIDHRRAAAEAAADAMQLWRAERDRKQAKRRTSKADRWQDLCDKVLDQKPVNWGRVSKDLRLRVARVSNLPDYTARELREFALPDEDDEFDTRVDVRLELAGNTAVPEDVARDLLTDENPDVRAAAAAVQPLPEDLLGPLAWDPATIRAILKNPACPEVLVDRLVLGLLNPKSRYTAFITGKEFQEALEAWFPLESFSGYNGYSFKRRCLDIILRSERTSGETLHHIAESQQVSYTDLVTVVQHPNVLPETLDLLAVDTRKTVREAVVARRASL